MRRLAILATAALLPAAAVGQDEAKPVQQVPTLSLEGARTILRTAEQKAQELHAPSSLAVVDARGDLLLFEQMQGARPVGIGLSMGKARSAARFETPTQALEATVNNGRSAAVTAGQVEMQGGVPVRAGGQVVGAVGVSGFDKEKDVQIADSAAAAVR
jgi:glc operon protein GlcG